MTVHSNSPAVRWGQCGKRTSLVEPGILAAGIVVAALGLHSGFSFAAESAGAPAMAPVAAPAMAPVAAPPGGEYKLDKSHASLILRASHMGFSTYTTRFSRFDSELTFDPKNLPASKIVTTIDASSFEMDAAPQMCLDIMKGPQMLDTAKYAQITFKSERVRITGSKTMEITGTLTLHGVTRPMVLSATYNGGYAGMPQMDPNARVGFSAHGSLKRSDFGMTFGVTRMTPHDHVLEYGRLVLRKMGGFAARRSSETGGRGRAHKGQGACRNRAPVRS